MKNKRYLLVAVIMTLFLGLSRVDATTSMTISDANPESLAALIAEDGSFWGRIVGEHVFTANEVGSLNLFDYMWAGQTITATGANNMLVFDVAVPVLNSGTWTLNIFGGLTGTPPTSVTISYINGTPVMEVQLSVLVSQLDAMKVQLDAVGTITTNTEAAATVKLIADAKAKIVEIQVIQPGFVTTAYNTSIGNAQDAVDRYNGFNLLMPLGATGLFGLIDLAPGTVVPDISMDVEDTFVTITVGSDWDVFPIVEGRLFISDELLTLLGHDPADVTSVHLTGDADGLVLTVDEEDGTSYVYTFASAFEILKTMLQDELDELADIANYFYDLCAMEDSIVSGLAATLTEVNGLITQLYDDFSYVAVEADFDNWEYIEWAENAECIVVTVPDALEGDFELMEFTIDGNDETPPAITIVLTENDITVGAVTLDILLGEFVVTPAFLYALFSSNDVTDFTIDFTVTDEITITATVAGEDYVYIFEVV